MALQELLLGYLQVLLLAASQPVVGMGTELCCAATHAYVQPEAALQMPSSLSAVDKGICSCGQALILVFINYQVVASSSVLQ